MSSNSNRLNNKSKSDISLAKAKQIRKFLVDNGLLVPLGGDKYKVGPMVHFEGEDQSQKPSYNPTAKWYDQPLEL